MRRKTKVRKKKIQRPRFSVFLFFLVLSLALGAYILSLPVWKINDVVVNGTKMLSADEIRTLAAVPLSENLFFTSFSRAKANLGKIHTIKRFRIYRIPPGTVLISITERKPVATLVFPKRSVVIDEEGFILDRNANISLRIPNVADLPVISGISERNILEGKRIDERTSRVVTEVILKLSAFLESRSMQLELGELENVSFLLDDLLRVRVGSSKDIKRKMEVFRALLPVISGKWARVVYIDVRYPDNPVIKYK